MLASGLTLKWSPDGPTRVGSRSKRTASFGMRKNPDVWENPSPARAPRPALRWLAVGSGWLRVPFALFPRPSSSQVSPILYKKLFSTHRVTDSPFLPFRCLQNEVSLASDGPCRVSCVSGELTSCACSSALSRLNIANPVRWLPQPLDRPQTQELTFFHLALFLQATGQQKLLDIGEATRSWFRISAPGSTVAFGEGGMEQEAERAREVEEVRAGVRAGMKWKQATGGGFKATEQGQEPRQASTDDRPLPPLLRRPPLQMRSADSESSTTRGCRRRCPPTRASLLVCPPKLPLCVETDLQALLASLRLPLSGLPRRPLSPSPSTHDSLPIQHR